MTTSAQTFVSCIPSTEEEMVAISLEVARQEKTAVKFEQQIENIEQLASVMRWYLNTHRKPQST